MSKTKYLVFWSPYEEDTGFSKANILKDLFVNRKNIIVVDLKNNKDPRSLFLIREADLVVVFLQHNELLMDRYFQQDMVRNENVVYVITDFFYDGQDSWRRALDRYRIPNNQLYILPVNHRLQLLQNEEQLKRFVAEEGAEPMYRMPLDFPKCFRALREGLVYSLE